jgi:hypothetical protein
VGILPQRRVFTSEGYLDILRGIDFPAKWGVFS